MSEDYTVWPRIFFMRKEIFYLHFISLIEFMNLNSLSTFIPCVKHGENNGKLSNILRSVSFGGCKIGICARSMSLW